MQSKKLVMMSSGHEDSSSYIHCHLKCFTNKDELRSMELNTVYFTTYIANMDCESTNSTEHEKTILQSNLISVIFAGFLLVHEVVLGEGVLQPVTGALVFVKRDLQLELFDGHQIHPPHIIGCAKTKFVHLALRHALRHAQGCI